MLKDKFIALCNQRKVAPTVVCNSVGLSNAAFSGWTDKTIPREATLQRIAEYFNVSINYLLGRSAEDAYDAFIRSIPDLECANDITRLKLDLIEMQDEMSPEYLKRVYNFAREQSAASDFAGLGHDPYEQEQALLERYRRMDVVHRAQLLARAEELDKAKK